jgi:hypothetical protein|tara:strand:+ start:203 stop:454 length:252 start_codon:yes stop_codon:yes gene_type:complete
MDERVEKEEVNYTPEMAGWGDNESIKENNQMEWLKGRVKEISTWSGASLVALGLLVVLGGPLVKLAAYAAIIWGVVSIVKKQG